MYRIEVYVDKAGKFRWRMCAPNGTIMADGAQGYARRYLARDGFMRVRRVLYRGDAVNIVHLGKSGAEIPAPRSTKRRC